MPDGRLKPRASTVPSTRLTGRNSPETADQNTNGRFASPQRDFPNDCMRMDGSPHGRERASLLY